MKHLVFYDGACGLCDHIVQFLLKIDKKRNFIFAPLQGKTFINFFKNNSDIYQRTDSLILIENYQTKTQIYRYGKGAFRIAWLLGGPWKLIGWIHFLPSLLYDWAYFIIARNRHFFFRNQTCFLPDLNQKDRFLE